MADYEESNDLGSRYYYSYKGWGLARNKYIHIHTHVMRQFGPHQQKLMVKFSFKGHKCTPFFCGWSATSSRPYLPPLDLNICGICVPMSVASFKRKGKKEIGCTNTYLISKSNCQMKSYYDVKMFSFWFQRIVVRDKKHRHKLQPNGKSDSHPLIIHPSRCTSCDHLGMYVNPVGKKCFLVPLAAVHPLMVHLWLLC